MLVIKCLKQVENQNKSGWRDQKSDFSAKFKSKIQVL